MVSTDYLLQIAAATLLTALVLLIIGICKLYFDNKTYNSYHMIWCHCSYYIYTCTSCIYIVIVRKFTSHFKWSAINHSREPCLFGIWINFEQQAYRGDWGSKCIFLQFFLHNSCQTLMIRNPVLFVNLVIMIMAIVIMIILKFAVDNNKPPLYNNIL